jgi:hypothetical protein
MKKYGNGGIAPRILGHGTRELSGVLHAPAT